MHSLLLAVLLASFVPGPPVTQVMETARYVTVSGVNVDARPLNASFTTDQMIVAGLRWVTWEMLYTRSTASIVTMACQHSADGLTWFDIQMLVYASAGRHTSYQRFWDEAVAASSNWVWTVPSYDAYMRCTFSATGAAVGDTVTIKARSGK